MPGSCASAATPSVLNYVLEGAELSAQSTVKKLMLNYVKAMGAEGPIRNPYDIAFSKDGKVFILNRGGPVTVVNWDEDYLYTFGSDPEDNAEYGMAFTKRRLPTAIALDSQDHVYIADEYNHNISVFEVSGKFLSRWGVFGSGDGQMDGPSGLAFDAEDNLFVVDQNNNRIQKFTSDGRYLMQWGGGPGNGDGQFNLPWGVTLDSQGLVYVADWRNDRIQKFTPDGRFLAKFGQSGEGDGQFHRPSDVAVDSEGYIYVADWGNERVQVLGPDGSFQVKERGRATPSKAAAEFLDHTPDEKAAREGSNLFPEKDLQPHLRTPYIIASQTEPYLWGPTSVNLDKEEHLFVTETAHHRIQIFQRG